MIGGRDLVVSLLIGLAASCVAWVFLRPPRRLAGRVRPYAPGARTELGSPEDWTQVGHAAGIGSIFLPLFASLGQALSAVIDAEPEVTLRRRITQAGMYPAHPEERRVAAYRTRQLLSTVVGGVAGFGGGTVLGLSGSGASLLAVLGIVVGSTRQRGRLEREIERRRERMRIEIYTVNQLLALRIRSGGGVTHAITELVQRLRGDVALELREGMRMVKAGLPVSDALDRLAERTPEPYCARTYSALATAGDRGADLGGVLLNLADEVRKARRETMRRRAVKRRAAMLIPTIGLMAPVLLLFIAAPLPRIVLGSF